MKKVIKTLAITTTLFTLALPTSVYANQWIQDNAGWKVQADDGTYLMNQWYQSPESGLWYYIGTDGYMLTNATTPDGYPVDQNGVWIQTPEPEVPSTESNDEEISAEEQAEWEKIQQELKDSAKDVHIIDNSNAGPDAAGYDGSGEINLNGGM